MRGLELMAGLSVLCIVGAGVCFVLARRSSGGSATVFRWFTLVLAVAALGPPLIVVWAVNN